MLQMSEAVVYFLLLSTSGAINDGEPQNRNLFSSAFKLVLSPKSIKTYDNDFFTMIFLHADRIIGRFFF